MIVGLSGYARAGKDEAAKGLQAVGFTRVGFADRLREFLYRLNPVVLGPNGTVWSVRPVIDRHGWDGYKATPYGDHIRRYLQRLGTECGRELIGDTVWIDAALRDVPENVVVTDARFPNEAQAIRDRGGIVVRITRPGVGPANSHQSETALDGWPFDAVIVNDGTIAELHARIRQIVAGAA